MAGPCRTQFSSLFLASSGLSGLTSPTRPEGPALASVGLLEGLGSPGVEECSQAPQKPEQTLPSRDFSHNPSPSPTPPFTQLQEMREMEREAQQTCTRASHDCFICELIKSPRCHLFQTRRTKPFFSANNRANSASKLSRLNNQAGFSLSQGKPSMHQIPQPGTHLFAPLAIC